MQVNLPNNEWKLGFKNVQNGNTMFEFVRQEENIKNWHELITIQSYSGLQNKTTPQLFIINFLNLIRQNAGNLSYQVIQNNQNDVIVEWKVKGNGLVDTQCELIRAVAGKENMHVIHYVVKEPNISAYREQWINFIKSARISTR